MLRPRLALVIVLLVFAALVAVAYGPALPRWALSVLYLRADGDPLTEAFGTRMVGLVQGGDFLPVDQVLGATFPARLTGMPMQAARAPESEAIDLSAYEGQAIAVWGHGGGGGWIYSAQVEGPLDALSAALVRWAR